MKTSLWWLAVPCASLVAITGCSSSNDASGSSPDGSVQDGAGPGDTSTTAPADGGGTSDALAADTGPASATGSNDSGSGDAGAPDSALEDFNATAADFDCDTSSEWTAVGNSHYKNALGHSAATLAVAQSADGGIFPVGTVIQLNPAEAMIKRAPGFASTSNDWEFFTLDVSDAGTTIVTRGGGSTVSNANGTCLGCHVMAVPAWDMVCGDDPDGGPTTTHGCNPLPVPNSVLAALHDPRCP